MLDVVATACGVPAGSKAIVVNVTTVRPDQWRRGRPFGGGATSAAGTVRFRAGTTRANNGVVRLTADGLRITPTLEASGSTHVVIDVVGYFDLSP